MSDTARASMRGISKRYGPALVLHDVDFEASAGEIHALVGENGAGKSTLIRILAGAVRRDAGRMAVDGVAYEPRSPHDARRLGIRAVHQEFSLVSHLSVAENLLLGELPTRGPGLIDWAAAHRIAAESLATLGFEGIDTRLRVDRLGVSQRQMVEIAKALRGDPRVVVLDEPSAVLSQGELERLFAVLRAFRAAGGAVIYVSHRLDEVLGIADRVTVLKDGARVGTVATRAVDEQGLVRMMVGRPLSEIYPPRRRRAPEALLVLEGLHGRGFEDISLTLGEGEIVGLFGLVGAGRTELARAIFGAQPATSGRMRLGGSPTGLGHPGTHCGAAWRCSGRIARAMGSCSPQRCWTTSPWPRSDG